MKKGRWIMGFSRVKTTLSNFVGHVFYKYACAQTQCILYWTDISYIGLLGCKSFSYLYGCCKPVKKALVKWTRAKLGSRSSTKSITLKVQKRRNYSTFSWICRFMFGSLHSSIYVGHYKVLHYMITNRKSLSMPKKK